MDEVNEPAERERPQALAPADEAMLARAQTLREITDAALRDVAQLYPADDHGSVLRDALFLQGLAERLVDQAVVAERERGASWTDIGHAASSSRQSAHERWNTTVGAWVLMQRRRTGIGRGPADPATHACDLDEWYEDLVGEQRAVSTLLSSLGDEAARAEGETRRAEARHLHDRAEELRKEIDAAYSAAMAATGTPAAREKREMWAAKHLARAAIYERLATVEEPLAPEHRRRAATQRSLAQDIARDRAPQSLPADDGTRQQVHAAYLELSDAERRGSKRAVAALLTERLNGVGADSVRKHLDAVIEAERTSYVLDITACSDPDTAQATATSLLQDYAPNTNFWRSQSHRLLSRYLMAAALDDADAATLHTWITHPDNRRPVELLRSGPMPEWADEVEEILSSHRKTRDNVLLVLQSVLQARVPPFKRSSR
ncbi:hypothetical protein [Streptomyces rugosispiralis]|uniref:Uncharacterized protein n=1 Tax=Streptomyces rugosispiralis TaxID=2967341 RepID=A0ABT1VB73_9ACTN|nr:hypothetical protein [Streptomyces rugosispiralis]MCQ8194645.1 hypothetical protein [Streptomyces rugosispiralis]